MLLVYYISFNKKANLKCSDRCIVIVQYLSLAQTGQKNEPDRCIHITRGTKDIKNRGQAHMNDICEHFCGFDFITMIIVSFFEGYQCKLHLEI